MTKGSLGFRKAVSGDIAGLINLAVERHGHRTRPVKTESFGVLRLMQPLYLDDSGQVTYIVMNPGGAYFGEKYRYSIDVRPTAQLLLSSQGATRIYKTPLEPAVQEATFLLRAGSRLEYVPDQVIAYRDADYRQFTKIMVAPDAQGFFAEVVTPGWDPQDDKFTYSGMHLRIDVHPEVGSGFVIVDNVRIQPGVIGHAISGIGYLEGATHMGSILVLGQHTQGSYSNAVRDIVEASGPAKVGVTQGVRHGIAWLMVRALANSTDELNRMILAINAFDRSVTTGQSRLDLRRY